MFSLMACCFQWIKERREPRKQVTLVLIGLDNSGKTTALKGVQGESLDLVAPTVGFASADFKLGKFDVTVFDLGGGKRIRGIWSNYYAESHGVIFVLDASAEDRLQECKECLEDVLKKEMIRGKRILLLANKQDQDGALDEIDICDQLDLEEIVRNSKCPCRVETCSAVQGIGKRMDPSIKEGIQWLLDGIGDDWPKISKRVEEDTAAQREEEKRKREEKRERVAREKEARKKREEEERKAQGLPAEEEEDEDEADVVDGGDPFKKVDDKYFAKKKQEAAEAKEKEKKKKKKGSAEDNKEKENKTNENIAMTESSASQRDGTRTIPGDIINEDVRSNGDGGNERTSMSGPLSPDAVSDGKQSASGEGGSIGEEESKKIAVGSQENLIEEPPNNGEEKKKKKKKKIKKNKTAPMPVEGIDELAPSHLSSPLATPSWAQAPGHRNLFKSSQKPSLAPLVEQSSPRPALEPLVPSSTVNHRRKEVLPELRPRSTKPNIEDDDDVMT